MTDQSIRLLIVDDHASFREPLAILLDREPDLRVVGQAATFAEGRVVIGSVGADIAIIDLDLPGGSGAELIRDLRHQNPDATVLVLTGSEARLDHARAIEAGAAYVMHKSARIAEVIAALRQLAAGRELLPPRQVIEQLRFAADRQAADFPARQALARLTPREVETLQALADGLDNAQIASRFFISTETVRAHVRNILAKLDVDSRLQAVLLALRYGVIKLS